MNFPIHFCDLLDGRDVGIMQKTFEVGVWEGLFALLSACPGLTHCFRRDSLTIFRQCIWGGEWSGEIEREGGEA